MKLWSIGPNPALNDVPGRPPMFIFAGESGKSAALVHGRSLVFAPTVAKTVAIIGLSVDREFCIYPLWIEPLYKTPMQETIELADQRHRVSTRLRHIAAQIGKEVAEAVRDILVMVAGEATTRAIWG